jgi:hypothetical protein
MSVATRGPAVETVGGVRLARMTGVRSRKIP